MLEFTQSYEQHKQMVLKEIKAKRTYNNEGKIAICKDCKNDKQLKMSHLKEEYFINR